MWAKIDDQFYMSVKNALMDRDEQDLYLAGIVYCSGQLSDGFIPLAKLPLLIAWAKLPLEANAQAIASSLVEHGFWEVVATGFKVHDYLDWNPSRAEVLALREARAEAGKLGGIRSGASRKSQSEAIAKANASASAQAKLKQNRTPSPSLLTSSSKEDESPADASSPSRNGNGRSTGKGKDTPVSEPTPSVYQLASAIAEVCGMSFETNKGRLLKDAKLMVDAKPSPPPTPDALRENYGLGGWWWSNDWRGKKKEWPQPATIRETWGKWRVTAPQEIPVEVYR